MPPVMPPLACKASPPDARDYRFDQLGLRLVSPRWDHRIDDRSSPISDQGSVGSCVGNAVSDAIEILRRDGAQVSRLFVYYNARVSHGGQREDAGTFPRAALQSVVDLGVCPEEDWPYDTRVVNMQPDGHCYLMARDRLGSSAAYARVFGSDDTEAAICSDHPVIIAAHVDDAFGAYRGGGVLEPGGVIRGQHAVLLIGVFADGSFLLRNSWGTGWGDGGYAHVSREWVDDRAFERWVLKAGV